MNMRKRDESLSQLVRRNNREMHLALIIPLLIFVAYVVLDTVVF